MSGFDETFDWVVVGSGAGAMVSALVMHQAAKSVLVLEKCSQVGGTTAKSGGMLWIPNNRFMHEAGDGDSTEAAMQYLDALCEDLPGSTREKRLAYVVEGPRMVDFLVGCGVELERASAFWPDYYDELPGGVKTSRSVVAKPFDKKRLGAWEGKLRAGFLDMNVRLDDALQLPFAAKSWAIRKVFVRVALRHVWGMLRGRRFTTAGAALQGRLLEAGLAAGVVLRTDSRVSQLLVEDGKVTGVVANGKRIGARLGVLVNAGGFALNQAMRDRYQPGTQAAWSNVAEGDTGEMIAELERVGGTLGQMDQMVGYQSTLMPGWEQEYVKPPAQTITGKPGAILVDQTGVRYMNEGGSYELYCQTMLERNRKVPAVPSWAVFDARFAANYQIANKSVTKQAKAWVEAGYLKQADTVSGLAEAMAVPPDALEASVARWNGFVANGEDADFHRGARAYDKWLGDPFHGPNPALGAIGEAPFYAVPVVPGDVSTYGGVVTDAEGRVTGTDGKPIPGLYATGTSAASVMGGVYPGAGASIGPAMTFAYVAARHAAGLGNQI